MSKFANASRIVVTLGEPAGVGADVLIQLAQQARTQQLLACACPKTLVERARQLGLTLRIHNTEDPAGVLRTDAGELSVWPVDTAEPVVTGKLCKKNATYVTKCLERATELCLNMRGYALVTGPIHKGHLVASGIDFRGHTEYLARLCHTEKPVMLLANNTMRIVLATTHLPLSEVAPAINAELLAHTLTVTHSFLKSQLNIKQPVIAVCGLNPHAGDDGALGHEEQTVIAPCLEGLRKHGMKLLGPLSADTAFIRPEVRKADAVLVMYHDQGLPVLKYAGFTNTVNITLGLPIVRTSVDHGTALDIAGSGKADHHSMEAAVRTASQLMNARTHGHSIH